ncbi:MAG: hypothetical protein SGI73_03895 [Chloroflexota bacterium]|nr:hypothetical protein [Chloroflexota bacterium]
MALVFGIFYLFQGAQTFLRTGGMGVEESTRQAQILASATQERATRAVRQYTAMPTATPQPTCTDFRVIVPNAIVRQSASANAAVLTSFNQGTIICVLWRDPGSEWFTIDRDTETRRRELAYMHESVIEPLNPTPTILPTETFPPTAAIRATLPPTVTPPPSQTALTSDTARPPASTRTSAPTATPIGTRSVPVTPSPAPDTDNVPTLPPRTTEIPTPTEGVPMQNA